jgi:hypothetical protein
MVKARRSWRAREVRVSMGHFVSNFVKYVKGYFGRFG